MVYVGIDVAKEKFDVAAITIDAKLVGKHLCFSQTTDGFAEFGRSLAEWGSRDTVKIGIESSGRYGAHLWRHLLAEGWNVEVFNPVLTASANRNVRGRKTDKDDAVAIAKIVRDGNYSPVEVSDAVYLEMRELCRQRKHFVKELSSAKKRLLSLIDQTFPEFPSIFSDTYCASSLALLEKAPSATACLKLGPRRMEKILLKASRGRSGKAKAELARDTAAGSLAKGVENPGVEMSIRMQIKHIRFLEDMIAQLDEKIEELYALVETDLKSITGIGGVLAPIIISELGDLERFNTPGGPAMSKRVLAYAGMEPKIRTSGKWSGKVKISKRGSPTLRTALYNAAWAASQHNVAFKHQYDKQRKKGKCHKVAVINVARKLVEIICSMHKHGTKFDVDKFLQKKA